MEFGKVKELRESGKYCFQLLLLFFNALFVVFIFSLFKSPAEGYFEEGQALQSAKDYSAASSAYARAIKTDPKYFKALFPFAQCLEALKDYKNAIKYYSLAIEVDSSNTDAYYSRGLLFRNFTLVNKSNEMYKLGEWPTFVRNVP